MATNSTAHNSKPSRRTLLRAGAGGTIALLAPYATAGLAADSTTLAKPFHQHTLLATWGDSKGYHAGLVRIANGVLSVVQSHPLPTRAHGVLQLPDGSLLVMARRPGDWMLHWHPFTPTQSHQSRQSRQSGKPRLIWADDESTFNGHAVCNADGTQVYTTETDTLTGDGLLVVRDARTLRKLHTWRTHGLDPHDLLVRNDNGRDSIWIANGGIRTERTTGRTKLNLAHMDSSLVQLDAHTGKRISQWRVADPRLSIRHIAHNRHTIAASLQAQHDSTAQQHTAPILATCNPLQPNVAKASQTMVLHTLQPPANHPTTNLKGYGGDITAWHNGFVISAPKAHTAVIWQPNNTKKTTQFLSIPKVCPLANTKNNHLMLGGHGAGNILTNQTKRQIFTVPDDMQLDNHWMIMDS